MLVDIGLPKTLWSEALKYAIFVRNRYWTSGSNT